MLVIIVDFFMLLVAIVCLNSALKIIGSFISKYFFRRWSKL